MGKKSKKPSKTQNNKAFLLESKKTAKESDEKSVKLPDKDLLLSMPLGLQNIGNTCYFNSTLQSIACSRRYLQFKLSDMIFTTEVTGKITMSLHSILLKLRNQKKESMMFVTASSSSFSSSNGLYSSSSVNPSSLLTSITSENAQFHGRSQQDAHELYVCLMSSLKEEYEKSLKSITSTTSIIEEATRLSQTEPIHTQDSTKVFPKSFSSCYDGLCCSVVKCHECLSKWATLENYFDLSLSIPGTESLMTIRTPLLSRAVKMIKSVTSTHSGGSLVTDQEVLPPHAKQSKDKNVEVSSPSKDSKEDVDTMTNKFEDVRITETSTENPISSSLSSSPSSSSIVMTDSILLTEHHEGYVRQQQKKVEEDKISIADDIIEPSLPTMKHSNGHHVTIYDCLDIFTSEEPLRITNGNGFSCSRCEKTTNASKRILPLEIPTCLVIHLKRLLPGGKYDKFIEFPMTLDMSKYIARRKSKLNEKIPSCENKFSYEYHGTDKLVTDEIGDKIITGISPSLDESIVSDSTGNKNSKLDESLLFGQYKDDFYRVSGDNVTIPNSTYTLVATIVHQGSSRGGHYISYVKYKNIWYYTSDSTIKRCSESDVLASQAYMLFYVR